MKNFRAIKTLIAVIVIIFSVLAIFNIIDSGIVMSIAFVLLGIISILDGYSSYIRNRKREAIFLFLSGLFIIFVSVFTRFFRNV